MQSVFPQPGTEARLIVDFLFSVEKATLGEIRAAVGQQIAVNDRISQILSRRRTTCVVTRKGGYWSLTAQARKTVQDERFPPPPVVKPAQTFAQKPLSKQYMISALGTREGSNEWRDIPSRHIV